jgi:methionyl-tRNA formyltransferase
MSLRIIAFVDHEIGFRLLEKLILLRSRNELQLEAVVTTIENGKMWWPGVNDLCAKNKIPLFRYQNPFNKILAFEQIDWYFLLSWKHVIPELLINHPRKGVVNLHYSLLPEYRGVYPVNWAIIDGKELTGVTYHLVNAKIDDGQIICQKETSIFMNDTARSLQLRLDNIAYELFDSLLECIVNVDFKKVLNLDNRKRINSYRSRKDFDKICEIALNRNYKGSEFLNLLRGLTFYPNSKNAFFIDPKTGRKIYVSLKMMNDE